jgi:DNA repair exonuclease SbcCD ATPase subunit
MPERARHDEQLLDLPPEEDVTPGEHLDSQVQKAQEQLLHLKRQQEMIERQKRELEELSRRQEQLQSGKSEMVEKFTRALVVVERETYDAQKRVEQLHAIHDSFNQHLDVLESLNPKAWEGLDINKELSKSLSAIDDARTEYTRSLPKISPETDAERDPVAATAGYQLDFGPERAKDFVYWFKMGAAFTLPLMLVLIIAALLLMSALSHV